MLVDSESDAAGAPVLIDVDSVIRLGRLALTFGKVDRITFHPDGTTPESDTDHTVMLGLVACAFAAAHLPCLDLGLVAQLALVHDLVEAYAGDTPTLHALSSTDKAGKEEREHRAFLRIFDEFSGSLPWLPARIAEYEHRTTPEARYVKAMDKLLPKITHILNDLATIRSQRMSVAALTARYELQLSEISAYAADFAPLLELRTGLVERVLALAGAAVNDGVSLAGSR